MQCVGNFYAVLERYGMIYPKEAVGHYHFEVICVCLKQAGKLTCHIFRAINTPKGGSGHD